MFPWYNISLTFGTSLRLFRRAVCFLFFSFDITGDGDKAAHITWNFFDIMRNNGIVVRYSGRVSIELEEEHDEGNQRQNAGERIGPHGNIIHETSN